MKISQLHLRAFGPFTNGQLDFSKTNFNLIYGPNEAGKSSSLRAITAMLFGIPSKTSDDFIHRYAELRVGATLTNSEGRELLFARRKKIKGSLVTLDDAEKVLPENVLDDFLRGTEKQRFIDIHCINHEQFREGGNLMLNLKGLADDSLLVASTSANFPSLQNELRESVSQLYASRKRSCDLLTSIAAYKEAKEHKADCEVSVKRWQTLEHDKTQLEVQKNEIVEHRTKLDTEKRKLDRMRTALPKIADWKRRNEELGGKATLLLPTSYDISERQDCYSQRNTAIARIKELDNEVCELQSSLHDIKQSPELIAHAAQIDDLQQRIGGQLKDNESREQKTRELEYAERDVKRMLSEIGSNIEFNEIDRLRVPFEQRSTIRGLATEEKQLRDEPRRLQTAITKTEQSLKETKKQLENSQSTLDLRELAAAVKLAEREAGIEDEIRTQQRELKKLETRAARELSSLPHWNGTLEQLAQASVPLQETIQRYASEFVRSEEQYNAISRSLEKSKAELSDIQQQIAASERATAGVTEEVLRAARTQREIGWKLIKDAWQNNKKNDTAIQSYAGPQSLDQKYESDVADADNVSDRLRREADRVAKLTQLQEQERACVALTKKLVADQKSLLKEQNKQQSEWLQQWQTSGVSNAQTPDEMAAWLKQRDALLHLADDSSSLHQELEANQTLHQSSWDAVVAQLQKCDVQQDGDSLSHVLHFANEILADHQAKQSNRQHLEAEQQRLASELEQLKTDESAASKELEQWQTGWAAAMEWIDCEAETTAVQALARLEGIEKLTDRFEDWTKSTQQIAAASAATQRFETDVKNICERVKISESDAKPIEVAQQLKQLLDKARSKEQAAKQKTESLKKQTAKMTELKQESSDLDRRLAEFLQLAGVKSHDELLNVEALSILSQQRESAETEIRNIAGGVDFEDFLKQAEGKDEAELEANIERLNVEIAELDEKRDEVAARLNEVVKAMDEIDGNDSAAHADQVAINRLSRVHEVAGRYVRLKIAESILRQQVERYREENKDPLLAKASEFFATMTCNEFSGLQMDYDEKDGRPIIVGVRAGSKTTVDVKAMSDGTRDPMFLALRLAYLQRRLGQYEPMPFIVDDILIHLDDQRAVATLRVLAELSEQMQVLFFTHHDRLRELAEKHLPSEQLTVHELEKANAQIAASPRRPK